MQLIETINNKNYRIDLATRQITFLDQRWYYAESGNHVPSVTTILNAYPKGPEYYQWLKKVGEEADTIRDEAGRRGSIVHELTERYDAGEEVSLFDVHGNISVRIGEWAMLEKYILFRQKTMWPIVHSEKNIVSEALGCAGTLDRVFLVNGKKMLVDIKTSNTIYAHYWLQLSAYKKLLAVECGEQVDSVAILWLNAKTRTEGKNGVIQGKGYQLIVRDEVDELKDFPRFLATQQLWLAENEDLRPSQMVYNLSHKL